MQIPLPRALVVLRAAIRNSIRSLIVGRHPVAHRLPSRYRGIMVIVCCDFCVAVASGAAQRTSGPIQIYNGPHSISLNVIQALY
jgi:hypothetical protein